MSAKSARDLNRPKRVCGLILAALLSNGLHGVCDEPDKGKDEGKPDALHLSLLRADAILNDLAKDRMKNPWVGKSVVLKSLTTNLRVGAKTVTMPDGRFFHRFEVKNVEKATNGQWLWIVDESLKGWVKEDEVVVEDEALAYFTNVLKREPPRAEAHYLRGSLEKEEQALADFSEAIRLDPKFAVAYVARAGVYKDDDPRALADLSHAIRLKPDLALAYGDRAVAHLRRKEFDQAITDLTQTIRINPGNRTAYTYRGMAYIEKKAWDRVVADLTEAIRLTPTGEDSFVSLTDIGPGALHWARGDAYRKLKKYDLATADFSEALRIAEAEPVFRDEGLIFISVFSRAGVWNSKRDYDSAIAGFTDAIKRSPNEEYMAIAYASRAQVRRQIKDLDGALADSTEALRHDASPAVKVFAYLNRGEIASDRNDLEAALADCAKAVRLLPEQAIVWVCRAEILNDNRRYERALADCDQAVEIEPKSPCGHDVRAWIRATCPEAKFRDGKKAVEEAIRACELTEWKSPACLDTLAAAEAESGDYAAAVKWGSKALELVHDDENKAILRSRLELFRKKQPYRDVRSADGNRRARYSMSEIPLAGR